MLGEHVMEQACQLLPSARVDLVKEAEEDLLGSSLLWRHAQVTELLHKSGCLAGGMMPAASLGPYTALSRSEQWLSSGRSNQPSPRQTLYF